MRNPEVFGDREISPVNLTESERRIVGSLTPEEIELVNRLRADNLTRQRAGIVGVRSEDLLFLLESIHKGYIPVGETELMAKGGAEHLYLTPNPESAYLRQHAPDVVGMCKRKTFQEMTRRNLDLYSEIAIKQSIQRNVMSGLSDDEKEKMVEEFRRNNPCSYEFRFEEFYKEVVYEVLNNRHPTRFDTGSKPALSALRHGIERSLSPKGADAFLRSLESRGGISLAFNESLFEKYQRVPETDAEGNDELVFDIPSGKLDLSAILGFETLGEFEDSVLDKIRSGQPSK